MFNGEAYIVTKDAQVVHALRYVESGDNCVVAECKNPLQDRAWWTELEVVKIFGINQKEEALAKANVVQEERWKRWLLEEDQIVNELQIIFRMDSFSPRLIDRALQETYPGWVVTNGQESIDHC